MAGEWLKFESSLPEKPETLAITIAMGWEDPDLTVGKLMRLFRWFDQHTLDGNAASVTPALLDRLIGVTGFVQAVANTGWLVINEAGLTLHNFEYHNGATAKTRAMTAKRVANHRASETSNDVCNGSSVTDALAKEEKKREEKNKQLKPKQTPDGELFPDVAEQIVSDFKAMRSKQRAPISKTAINGIAREAVKAGITLSAALTICCERNWRGFKAEWILQPNRGSPSGGKNDRSGAVAAVFGTAQNREMRDVN